MVSSMKFESLFCSARALCFPEISLFSLRTLLTNVEVNSALVASLFRPGEMPPSSSSLSEPVRPSMTSMTCSLDSCSLVSGSVVEEAGNGTAGSPQVTNLLQFVIWLPTAQLSSTAESESLQQTSSSWISIRWHDGALSTIPLQINILCVIHTVYCEA